MLEERQLKQRKRASMQQRHICWSLYLLKNSKVPPRWGIILFLACWHTICNCQCHVHRSDRCHYEQPCSSPSSPFSSASVSDRRSSIKPGPRMTMTWKEPQLTSHHARSLSHSKHLRFGSFYDCPVN